jgi:hypothetical protein
MAGVAGLQLARGWDLVDAHQISWCLCGLIIIEGVGMHHIHKGRDRMRCCANGRLCHGDAVLCSWVVCGDLCCQEHCDSASTVHARRSKKSRSLGLSTLEVLSAATAAPTPFLDVCGDCCNGCACFCSGCLCKWKMGLC